jgi:hypothetical protein
MEFICGNQSRYACEAFRAILNARLLLEIQYHLHPMGMGARGGSDFSRFQLSLPAIYRRRRNGRV